MATTTQYSTQITNGQRTSPPDLIRPDEWGAPFRVYFFDFTQDGAGDAGSVAHLVTLPPGYCRVILPLSRIYFEALGSSRTMDLGHAAYTQVDGTAVAQDPDDLDVDVDVSSAGSLTPGGTIGTHETKVFDSRGGVDLIAQINDGTFQDGKSLSGYFVVAHK